METQNIEYKVKWKDEYLHYISGFANADGGTLFIGLDDNGNIVGIDNAKLLLVNLPNKAVPRTVCRCSTSAISGTFALAYNGPDNLDTFNAECKRFAALDVILLGHIQTLNWHERLFLGLLVKLLMK